MLLVKYLLASINGILLLFLIGTVVGHIVSGNKLVSWSNAFNGLCILWLGMRQVFWAYAIYSPANWSAVRFYVLYWLPHPIQFAMYLIVPIFYVQILSRSGRQGFGMASPRFWQRRWRCIRNTYIALVSFMVFFLIGAVVAAATFEKEEYNCVSRHWHKDDFDDSSNSDSCFHDMSTNPVRWLSACCFLFLSVVIGVYGRQVCQVVIRGPSSSSCSSPSVSSSKLPLNDNPMENTNFPSFFTMLNPISLVSDRNADTSGGKALSDRSAATINCSECHTATDLRCPRSVRDHQYLWPLVLARYASHKQSGPRLRVGVLLHRMGLRADCSLSHYHHAAHEWQLRPADWLIHWYRWRRQGASAK